MGSVYAGLLAEAGNEVHVLDIWQEHIDTINEKGLRISGASGDRVVSGIVAHSSAQKIGDCDLVIIATKADGVEGAARAADALCGDDTLILTIQNGLGAGERIQAASSSPNILLGVAAGFGASMQGPGHAHHNKMQLIKVGEMSGGLTDRVEMVARVWQEAGFNVQANADINQLIWDKFVCNVTYSAPCTVFNNTIGELMSDPHAWGIAKRCAEEAFEAGCARGIRFTFEEIVPYVTAFGENMPDARPSMLLDHLDHRKSEIDAINGMVPVVAREVGTLAPYNEVVSEIIRSRELKF